MGTMTGGRGIKERLQQSQIASQDDDDGTH